MSLDFDDIDLNQEDEEFNGSLYQEINEIIDRTLGENVSSIKKEKLFEYLSDILQKNERKLISSLKAQNNISKNHHQPSKSIPQINIICYPSFPLNRTYIQPPIGYPQPINFISPQNACFTNYCPNQVPMQNYNFINTNQPLIQPVNTKTKSSKKHTKSDKKHKKSETKSKKKSEKKSETPSNSIEFIHQPGKEFDGIINYLSEKTHGNIHLNGTIEITTDVQNPQNKSAPKNLLDFKSNSSSKSSEYFMVSKGQTQFWICLDFKKMKVEISSYTIRNTRIANVPNIINWVLETSNDGQKWTQIDEQKNCMVFRNPNQTQTFDVKKCHKFAKFVRFRHTGGKLDPTNNHFSTFDCIAIQSIEFYGKLKNSI